MEQKLKTAELNLPKNQEGVIALFKRVLVLPKTMDIRVTPSSFTVSRYVAGDEDVVPEDIDVIPDFEFVTGKIAMEEIPFQPGAHPYLVVEAAMRMLTDTGLKICGILAPDASMLVAYLGLDLEVAPEYVLGHRVIYTEKTPSLEKLVIVGGSSHYFIDATHGVIVDMGV